MHGLQRFIFITLFSVCSAVQAGGEPEDIQALRNLLKPITSLSAKFTQEVSDADGFLLQASEGLFQVSQTAKLRWIVEQPMQQQIISDGETLWVFDPDLDQVIVQPFNQDIAATPAILFSDDLDQLDAAFFIREQAAGQFVLTPEQSGSLFNSMEIIFVDQQPVSISLTDNLEQVTTIAFTELVLNPNLAANLFVFEIPLGIDVINNAN